MTDKIFNPAKILNLSILKIDKIDKFLSFFTNLRKLELSDISVSLDYKVLFSQIKSLYKLSLSYSDSNAILAFKT